MEKEGKKRKYEEDISKREECCDMVKYRKA